MLPVSYKGIKTTISVVCMATLIPLLVASISWKVSIEEYKLVTREVKMRERRLMALKLNLIEYGTY